MGAVVRTARQPPSASLSLPLRAYRLWTTRAIRIRLMICLAMARAHFIREFSTVLHVTLVLVQLGKIALSPNFHAVQLYLDSV